MCLCELSPLKNLGKARFAIVLQLSVSMYLYADLSFKSAGRIALCPFVFIQLPEREREGEKGKGRQEKK